MIVLERGQGDPRPRCRPYRCLRSVLEWSIPEREVPPPGMVYWRASSGLDTCGDGKQQLVQWWLPIGFCVGRRVERASQHNHDVPGLRYPRGAFREIWDLIPQRSRKVPLHGQETLDRGNGRLCQMQSLLVRPQRSRWPTWPSQCQALSVPVSEQIHQFVEYALSFRPGSIVYIHKRPIECLPERVHD